MRRKAAGSTASPLSVIVLPNALMVFSWIPCGVIRASSASNADDDGHPDPESFPSDAAEDGSESAEEKDPASPGGSGSGSIVVAGAPAELLEELVRRRVREAQLEADASKLRV